MYCVCYFEAPEPWYKKSFSTTAGTNVAAASVLQLFPAYIGIMKAATEEARAEKAKEALVVLANLEEAFAQCSKGKPFFAGDSVGYLDLAVGCNLFWLEAIRKMFGVTFFDVGKTPLLAAWAERFAGTEMAREVVPDADTAVVFAKKLQARFGSNTSAK
uniref:Glutathione S-transferase n=1 Tax=Aegilops tauschii subsp. strangulata TaxID=200361 RepID=A0A453II37_AEGTS